MFEIVLIKLRITFLVLGFNFLIWVWYKLFIPLSLEHKTHNNKSLKIIQIFAWHQSRNFGKIKLSFCHQNSNLTWIVTEKSPLISKNTDMSITLPETVKHRLSFSENPQKLPQIVDLPSLLPKSFKSCRKPK